MSKRVTLKEIIKENNYCISNNPKGIERLWPKSYINNFYEDFFKKVKIKINSPKILEINQSNYLNIKLWMIYFGADNIENIDIFKLIRNKKNLTKKYDIIIISNPGIIKEFNQLKVLVNKLKINGTLIIENIGKEIKLVEIIYLNYFFSKNLVMHDFRFNSFLIKNCILTINHTNKNKIELKKIFSFLNILKYLMIEIFIFIIYKIKLLFN